MGIEKETYRPSKEEQEKAEKMMTPEQLEMSKERVRGFRQKLQNLLEEQERKSKEFQEAVKNGNFDAIYDGYAENAKSLKEVLASIDEWLVK